MTKTSQTAALAILKEIAGGDIGHAAFCGTWDGLSPVLIQPGAEWDCGGWACAHMPPEPVPAGWTLAPLRKDEWKLVRA